MSALEPIKAISRNKFEVLAGMTRDPRVIGVVHELEYYSDPGEGYLGVVLSDLVDRDFSAIVLARDEFEKFRCINLRVSFPIIDDARTWLIKELNANLASGIRIHPQGQASAPPLDLFEPVVPAGRQHEYFKRIHSHNAFLGARKVITEMMPHFTDIDGNFVRQFQSDGFDARLWELYLFAVLKESGIILDRSFHAPDYVGVRFEHAIAVEAVVVGRRPGETAEPIRKVPKLLPPDEIWEKVKDEMPIRFGSPLYSKSKKRYWELDHVRGKPFAIAIADFHDDQSMIWSHSALFPYLYGKRFKLEKNKNGQARQISVDVEAHSHSGKTIPAGFFRQPDSENISAVMTSASGTISKFNRMGRQAGYGDPRIKVVRAGYCYNDEPGAVTAKPFAYKVTEESAETWSEGLNVFHNPNAAIPLNPEVLPLAAHHFLDGDKIVSILPGFHPFSSWTFDLIPKSGGS
ncbi:MAG: glycosaminoglycan attachment protein [bacterium]